MKPSVSIVMNTIGEKHDVLIRSVASCLSQHGVDVQLIVSTVEGDPCIEWMASYPVTVVVMPKKDHPLKSPRGSFMQLNNALHLVKGEWFVFASGNDAIYPHKLISEIELCLEKGKEVCYSAYHSSDVNGKIVQTVSFHEYDFDKHMKGNFVSDVAVISKRLVDKYLPFRIELNNYAYWDLWLRIYEGEGNVFCYNPTPTWAYVQYDDSMHIIRRKNAGDLAAALVDRNNMLSLHKK